MYGCNYSVCGADFHNLFLFSKIRHHVMGYGIKHTMSCPCYLLVLCATVGVYRLTKSLHKADAIYNLDLMHFVSRSPTDLELVTNAQTINKGRITCFNCLPFFLKFAGYVEGTMIKQLNLCDSFFVQFY